MKRDKHTIDPNKKTSNCHWTNSTV